jgi:hypothetical protein
MVIVFPHLIAKSFSAVTIYPFIFIKNSAAKKDYVLLNHESIHIRQQKELIWIFFFIWYLLEYLIRLIYYRNSYLAYKNISFEREAYRYEYDLDYLKTRKRFGFLRFL